MEKPVVIASLYVPGLSGVLLSDIALINFALSRDQLALSAIEKYGDNFDWHYLEDGVTIQAVEKTIHRDFTHSCTLHNY